MASRTVGSDAGTLTMHGRMHMRARMHISHMHTRHAHMHMHMPHATQTHICAHAHAHAHAQSRTRACTYSVYEDLSHPSLSPPRLPLLRGAGALGEQELVAGYRDAVGVGECVGTLASRGAEQLAAGPVECWASTTWVDHKRARRSALHGEAYESLCVGCALWTSLCAQWAPRGLGLGLPRARRLPRTIWRRESCYQMQN